MNKMLRDIIKRELDKGRKQTELARSIGVSQSTIYKILRTNTTPDLETIKKVQKFSGLPMNLFIEDDEDDPATTDERNEKQIVDYVCEGCGKELKMDEAYFDGGKPLCYDCFFKDFRPGEKLVCIGCGKEMAEASLYVDGDKPLCYDCFFKNNKGWRAYTFHVTCSGFGATPEEAWRDAIDELKRDPGETPLYYLHKV